MIDVFWTPASNKSEEDPLWENLAWFDPEPAFKRIASQRDSDFLKCPVLQDYYRNTFVIKCPVDLTIQVKDNGHGQKFIQTDRYGDEFYNNFISSDPSINRTFSMFTLEFNYLFLSKESVIVESIPPQLETNTKDNLDNLRVITGQFDISKWVRPIFFGAEIKDISKPIIFKRGDPLMYIRFRTTDNKRVNLIRTEFNSDMKKTVYSCLGLKRYVTNNSMTENYNLAKYVVQQFKNKFFAKKCPFGFKGKT
jgi:hypothetical protein